MPLFSLIDWICTRLRGSEGPLPLPQVDGLLDNIDGGEPNLLPVALLSNPCGWTYRCGKTQSDARAPGNTGAVLG